MRLPNLGNVLVASFWFLPTIMVVGAVLAVLGLVELETWLGGQGTSQWPVLLHLEAETARSFLTVIATSVATIATTTFSLTIVALTLAARQYTPKMLHNYMSNRGTQLALGVLVSTFAYALLVLQAIRSDPGSVPALALTGALLLGFASIGAFIYFLHHLGSTLQDTSITSDIEQRTLKTIEHIFGGRDETTACRGQRDGTPVLAEGKSGYAQELEIDKLVKLMTEHDLVLTVERGAGEFAPKGAVLAWLFPSDRANREVVSKALNHFKMGHGRTHQQDVAYGIYQLVDIAVRSLSPSFNALTTASTCIDHIGSILRHLAPMELPSSRCYERDGKPRVILNSPTFDELVELGFGQIRTFGESHVVILVNLLEVIGDLEAVTVKPERRRQLVEQANHIAAAAERGIQANVDREVIGKQLRDVGNKLRDAGDVRSISVRSQRDGGVEA